MARDQINSILRSNKETKDLQILGIRYNMKGNCIAIAHPDTPVEKLKAHTDKFANIIAGNSSITAQLDTKWAHVALHSVDTGMAYGFEPWS